MFLARLIARNALRHRLRAFLTILGVTIAILAFGLLRTLLDAWYAGVAASSANRLVTRNAISLIIPLNLSMKEKIRQVEGVTRVAAGNWFGGVYVDEKNFFPNFAVDAEAYLDLYPEMLVPPDQRAAFLRERKGALVGQKLLDRFGWKLGDQVTLKGTIFPGQWEMTILAVYRGARKDVDETQLLFHWSYLNERMKQTSKRRADQVGFYMIGIADPTRAAEISRDIDRQFVNSLSETLTETEKAFQLGFVSMSDAILLAIKLVSFVVILIILAVAANTMAMSVRERLGEFAVLKTLGFGRWFVAGMILGESLTLSLTGGVLGLALIQPLAGAVGQRMAQFFPVFEASRETLVLGGTAALAVGLAAAVLPAVRAARAPIAQALQRIG